MDPKMDSLSLRYFGLPAQPLRLALVDPTDRYLRAWEPVPSFLQFDQQRVVFPLLLPPSPPFPPAHRLSAQPSWRTQIPQLSIWVLEPNPTAIREGCTERKTALETT